MALGKGLNSLIPQAGKKPAVLASVQLAPLAQDADAPSEHILGRAAGLSSSTVWHVPLSDIVPNTEQPRKHFSHAELTDLVASIKEHGIIQPLTVTEREDGGYELIAGERRLRAAQIAGLATVPALVRSVSQQEKLELALIENIQRQDLNPVEEAFSYDRLIQQFGLTQQQVADKVGKSRPYVANMVRLLELPEPVKRALIDGTLSVGKARALLSLKDEKEQVQMFHSFIGEGVSVRDVEQAVQQKGQLSRKGSVRRDPNVTAQEQLLEDRLGAKVHITQKGEKGTIVIEYHSREELKRLIEELA